MKAIKFLLTLVTLVMFFFTCSENDNVEPGPIPADSVDVSLTDDQATFLETVKDTVIRLEDIILENGQNVRSFLETNDPDFLQSYPSGRVAKSMALTPREQKLKFLARMYAMGNYLVDDDQHTYPSAGADSPAQTGLAYSWGSKDYNTRQVPPGVTGQCKDLKIYGLDCTGMIWAMTQAANLTVVPKYNFFVKYISNADKWTAAFKASADYKDLKMKDMGQLAKDKIKNGDIILWGAHVGVYLYGSFYQSNGTPNKPDCTKNLEIGKGPRRISLSNVLSWGGLGSYKVFRAIYGEDYALTVDLTGTDIALSPYFNFNYTDSCSFLVTVYENRDTVEVSSIINSPGTVESLTSIPPCTGSPLNQGNLLNIQSVRGYVIRTSGAPEVLLEIHSTFIFFPYVSQCETFTSQTNPGSTFEATYTMEWFPIDGAAHTYTTTGFNVAGEVVTMTATPQ